MFYKLLVFSILCIVSSSVSGQDRYAYINKYQDIAVAEMVRTKIPASIKLAQAILESNAGGSELALKSNNHFGIKCGSNWTGKTHHREDDDYVQGQLIKSCFREFNSSYECYVAHSDFLTDSGKAGRYGPLFDLERSDYVGWAHGLSKAGYATDPNYARRLIDLIEKYELYRFDNEYENQLAIRSSLLSTADHHVLNTNNVKYALASLGDNAEIFARRFDAKTNQIRRYNDDIYSNEQQLVAGSKVYLEPKHSKLNSKQKYHILKEGEDLVYVSQLYGIKLDALLKRNGLKNNEKPLPNQKITLNGKAKSELKTVNPYQVPDDKRSGTQKPVQGRTEEVTSAYAGNMIAAAGDFGGTDSTKHQVVKGDTLYGIARKYGVTVVELKRINNLTVDTIFVGQQLIWK